MVGELELDCEILTVPEEDQRVMIHTVRPGSPSCQALRLLKVVGTPDMVAPEI